MGFFKSLFGKSKDTAAKEKRPQEQIVREKEKHPEASKSKKVENRSKQNDKTSHPEVSKSNTIKNQSIKGNHAPKTEAVKPHLTESDDRKKKAAQSQLSKSNAVKSQSVNGVQKPKPEISKFDNNEVESPKRYKIPELKPVKTYFKDLEGHKNVLLLSMSTLPNLKDKDAKPKINKYCAVEEREQGTISYRIFSGISQLEPGTKFFISKLGEQGIKIDKIIVLTTEETKKEKKQYWNKSAVQLYCENIAKYINEGDVIETGLDRAIAEKLKESGNRKIHRLSDSFKELYPVREGDFNQDIMYPLNQDIADPLNQYIDVSLIDNAEENDPLQKVMTTLDELSGNQPINLFIDLQGGDRSGMFTLFGAMTTLRDRGVSIKEMISIEYGSFDVSPIKSETNRYAIIDLVSGIRAFTRYGKVEELENFLANRKRSGQGNPEEKKNEEELLAIMKEIDGCMQINDPEGFTNELKKFKDNPALLEEESYDDAQFKLIVKDLKETYDPLIKEKTTVLDQIQWFNEKAFLASALIFIEDKIPRFLLGDRAFIQATYFPQGMSKNDIFDLCGFDSTMQNRKDKVIFINGFKKISDRVESYFKSRLCNVWAHAVLDYMVDSGLSRSEGQKREDEEKILSNHLYDLIFKSNIKKDKGSFKNVISLLISVTQNISNGLLSEARIEYRDDQLHYYLGKEVKKKEFACAIWKTMILLSAGISENELEDMIRVYSGSNHSGNAERLNREFGKMDVCDSEELILYAEAYTEYRKVLNSPQNNQSVVNYEDLYKNAAFYANLNDEYYQACREYYHLSGTSGDRKGLKTIAGIKNKYLKITDNKDREITIKIGNGNESWEKKAILDACIRLYPALKKERNATSHALESSSNHMSYQYTKKAIFVFVELCKKLYMLSDE